MGLKPVAEGRHQGGLGRQRLSGIAWASPTAHQLTVEELGAELSVIANFAALEVRASATAKVAVKSLKEVGIDVAQRTALALKEAAKVGGGSQITNGAGRGVAVALELLCEGIEVGSTDSSAQAPQRLGRGEKRL